MTPNPPATRNGKTNCLPVSLPSTSTYLTGPRNAERTSETRWMPPIAVNFSLDSDETNTLPMVVRTVSD